MFARKILVFALIISLISVPAFASTTATTESYTPNIAQETDIVFWQTLPFAALWGYFIDRQFLTLIAPGHPVSWAGIGLAAGVVSAANAYIYAKKSVEVK